MNKQFGFSNLKLKKYTFGFAHIFLLIIIVLIGIAGIGYFAFKNWQIKTNSSYSLLNSPTPEISPIDTSNWKTYKNEEHGFEFKYPPQMTLIASPFGTSGDYASFYIKQTLQDSHEGTGNLFTITVYKNENIKQFLEQLSSYDSSKCYPTYTCSEITDIKISDQKAQTYSLKKNGEEINNYYINHNNFLYVIFWRLVTEGQQIENFGQILSTFKFVDSDKILIQSEAESPNGKYKVTIKKIADKFEKWVVLTNLENNEEKIIFATDPDSKLIDIGRFEDLSSDNWSPNGNYFFLLEHFPDSGELYIFNANGEDIADKAYLRGTELGYDNRSSLGSAEWIDDNRIIVETGNVMGKGLDYILKIE